MSQANANYEELYRFAQTLDHYLSTVQEETARLDAAFRQLGDTWHDEKRAQFEETFQQLRGVFQSFHDQGKQQVPYINELARRLEEYIKT